MIGTRAYQASKGFVQRPAVEGVRIANQDVKYVRGSNVYLAAHFGNAQRAVPVNPARLDSDWLYEGRIASKDGDNDRVRDINRQAYGPASVEALVASVVPGLTERQVLCIRPHSKKPAVIAEEKRLNGIQRAKKGVL